MFSLPQHPISYFGMPSLSGNTVDDVMITVPCGNCKELVPIPSSLIKQHTKRIKSQKLRLGTDNYCFGTRKIMLDDKLQLQRLDLEFKFEALKETKDQDTCADLLEQYTKAQSRYLSLLQEAVYMQKSMSEMIEENMIDSSDIVRRQIKRCDAYNKDLKDIRRTLDYLRKDNENLKRVRIAATNLSKKLASRFSEVGCYPFSDRSCTTARSSPIGYQHPRPDRTSITEQSTRPERSSRQVRSSSPDRAPIISRSPVPNELSQLSPSFSISPSASTKNPQDCSSSQNSSSRLKNMFQLSPLPADRSIYTRSQSTANRVPNEDHYLSENESASVGRASLAQELPVDLEIEDSELLYEP